MSITSQPGYTAPHDSCAVCDHCGETFLPRTRVGPNASRFCSIRCHDAFWNEKRRQQTPLASVGADAAGGIEKHSRQNHSELTSSSRIRRLTKLHRIFAELAHGRSLNRFEAESLGDHCLHSTVSTIQQRYRIIVSRREETVRGFGGHPTRVVRYWFEPAEQTKAMMLLDARGKPRA